MSQDGSDVISAAARNVTAEYRKMKDEEQILSGLMVAMAQVDEDDDPDRFDDSIDAAEQKIIDTRDSMGVSIEMLSTLVDD
jgi:hypothetical protein